MQTSEKLLLIHGSFTYARCTPHDNGRGDVWKCWYYLRSKQKPCHARISLVDGKISSDNSCFDHNHENEEKFIAKQKFTEAFITAIKNRKSNNPFCKINLEKEFYELKSSLDSKSYEHILSLNNIKYCASQYINKQCPEMVEEIFPQLDSIKKSVSDILVLFMYTQWKHHHLK